MFDCRLLAFFCYFPKLQQYKQIKHNNYKLKYKQLFNKNNFNNNHKKGNSACPLLPEGGKPPATPCTPPLISGCLHQIFYRIFPNTVTIANEFARNPLFREYVFDSLARPAEISNLRHLSEVLVWAPGERLGTRSPGACSPGRFSA